MSLFRASTADRLERDLTGYYGDSQIPSRSSRRVGAVTVTDASAMRHSAVWACLRLRSDLMSTFPVKVYRDLDGIAYETTKPPILTEPGGARVRMIEWLASSQRDLDRTGNAIGLITEVNGYGLPHRIELQPASACSVITRKGKLIYKIDNKEYPPEKVWHEKQHTVSGMPLGLSPVAHAAYSIGQYMSVQEFATAWYGGGGVPRARLKNTARIIEPTEAAAVKEVWKAAISHGDLFVHGSDWEYDIIQGARTDTAWLDAQRYSATDIARFFGCPSELIDAAVSGQNVTYASLTERNLQFLIMHLGPAVVRREDALTQAIPQPRYVKFNTSALLRMDDKTRAETVAAQIESRVLAPSEARELENRPKYTKAQLQEFEDLFGPPGGQPPPPPPGRPANPDQPGEAPA